MIGFGFSVFTQAILGAGGFAKGSSLALDFTSGNRRLDPRITFSRTTNATLTNSAGLVANAPMNLLTFSEQFDNAAWGKIGATVTANNIAAPNGTVTADKIVEVSAANAPRVRQSTSTTVGGSYTFSFYLKAAERSQVRLVMEGRANLSAYFNAATGQALPGGLGATAAMSLVEDGWYRCSLTYVATAATTDAYIATAENGVVITSGDPTKGIYIWGAQLELGSTATTYNPTTVKNLLGFTENFDNAAWTKSNASISATKVDDIYGQPFAQKLVEDTANDLHQVQQNVTVLSGTPYALSVYAKAGERSWISLYEDSGGTGSAWFDLSTGTVGTVTTGTASITSVGNGWYRCSLSYTQNGTTGRCGIAVASANGTRVYTGDGTSGIYIFGAQLSDSASVDPYVYQPVAAPTSTAYYGPRFDYDPVTLAPKGLLIEEQRTNLLTYSEQFDNAAWVKTRASVAANTTVAPNGTLTADKLVEDTASASHNAFLQVSGASNITYTLSCHFKAAERGFAYVRLSDGVSGNAYGFVNLSTLATGTSGSAVWTGVSVSAVAASDGWVRVSVTGTRNNTDSVVLAYVGVASTISTFSYAGDGTSGVYAWGAQLEAGAFATSYIPTVASQVTRAADIASMIGNNFARWYTQGQGMLYGEASKIGVNSTDYLAILHDGAASNRIQLAYSGVNAQYVIVENGTTQASANVALDPFLSAKYGVAFSINNTAGAFNGSATATDTSVNIPVVNTLVIGSPGVSIAGSRWWNGHISRIAYYGRRLSNTELQGITS